ncbi:MAG: hypothetical protein MI806_09470 [Minwuiales bacterium]|nr:hypothetical protein [Minwuiales bacterium]
MPTEEAIERLLTRELPSREAPDEAAWHAVWHAERLGALDPAASALTGGMLADRLPWVFVAGYQAAIRTVFPEVPATGWAAFAATEDKSDPAANAGPQLTPAAGSMRLNAAKSWIAQSRHVEHLVVTARDGAETAACVLVHRNQPGVTLTHRDAPRFLGAMSQGFAVFENVEIAPENLFPGKRIRRFGRCEPAFVMLAGAGFLLSRLSRADAALAESLTAAARNLATECAAPAPSPATLARLDSSLQDSVAHFAVVANVAAIPKWPEDSRLLSMYSEAIQRRGSRAG